MQPGPGITNPQVIREEKPQYTQEALKARIQGVVQVEVVIKEDGTVGQVRISRSLDRVFGLDAEALRAARAWRFKPAMKDGKPVPFVAIIELEFKVGETPVSDEDFMRGAVRQGTPGLVLPKVRHEEKPKYTKEAMDRKIQGVVVVEAVIDVTGSVDRVRLSKSLDKEYGLDEEALKAARLWKFEPGTLDGKPASVLVVIELEFRVGGRVAYSARSAASGSVREARRAGK
jgi:TonB family protein